MFHLFWEGFFVGGANLFGQASNLFSQLLRSIHWALQVRSVCNPLVFDACVASWPPLRGKRRNNALCQSLCNCFVWSPPWCIFPGWANMCELPCEHIMVKESAALYWALGTCWWTSADSTASGVSGLQDLVCHQPDQLQSTCMSTQNGFLEQVCFFCGVGLGFDNFLMPCCWFVNTTTELSCINEMAMSCWFAKLTMVESWCSGWLKQ